MKKRSLLDILESADIVCKNCGTKYGKYSVGCSSSWMGTCDVCGELKSVTEVRDYGYLSKGISVEREKHDIKPLFLRRKVDEVPEEKASYERGEISCHFTEEEICFLNECLDLIPEGHEALAPAVSDPDAIRLFEGIEKKINDLYDDYCVTYSLSPALKAYNEKYGTWGSGSPEEEKRWEGFRDAFVLFHSEKE